MCGCEICISTSMMKSELNSWRSMKIEKLISVSKISQNPGNC